MSGRILWSELWSLRRQIEDDVLKEWLDRQIGFVIVEDELVYDQRFLKMLDAYSIEEMEELLAGAPVQIVAEFVNKLPMKSLAKIIKSFRIQEARLIQEAWNNSRRPQIAGREETVVEHISS